MNWFIAIPMEVRLILLFAAGTVFGALANLAIYGLAWNSRPISPWMRPNPSAPARRWPDRLPIFGWLGLRREASLHGSGFWIRPLLVEMLCGLGLAGLYHWEIGIVALFPADMPRPPNPALPPNLPFILHEQFVVHAILIWLMLAASLIDVDEKTIPDAISRPGTLVGLFLAAVWPWSLLPDVYMQFPGKWDFKFLCVATPNSWPAWLAGAPNYWSLAIALACWTLWCLAILPRTWYGRHGWLRALALCWNRVVRQADTYRILCMGVVGALLIALVWYHGGDNWKALLKRIGRHGCRRRNYLDRPHNRPGRLESRGHGLRRRNAAEHDRGVPRLADLSDRVFPGPFCRAGGGLVAIFSHPRQGNPLRPVSLPGCACCDYILGPDMGLGLGHLRPGLVLGIGHAGLPGSHAPAFVFAADDFQRDPRMERLKIRLIRYHLLMVCCLFFAISDAYCSIPTWRIWRTQAARSERKMKPNIFDIQLLNIRQSLGF